MQNRITVGRRFCGKLHADQATDAGSILNDDRLTQTFRHAGTDGTGDQVIVSAGGRRHNNAHRAIRKTCTGLRMRNIGCPGRGEKQSE